MQTSLAAAQKEEQEEAARTAIKEDLALEGPPAARGAGDSDEVLPNPHGVATTVTMQFAVQVGQY